MKIIAIGLLVFFTCFQSSFANDLLGKLDGSVYTDTKGVFTTTLPSLEGELRDFPNAVSVFNITSGSQDSLEYYPVPEEELNKYKDEGAHNYHSAFIKRALINQRYKGNFKSVNIISEHLNNVNKTPLFITAIHLPGGSQMIDKKGNKKDLYVALGTLIHNHNIYVYQVAMPNINDVNAHQLTESMADKIVQWASHTEFKG